MVVILLGGGSGVGKTTVARATGAVHIAVDDEVPEEVAASSPFGDDEVWQLPRDQLPTALRAYTARLAPTVRALIERARHTDTEVVIEGEGIEPRLVAQCGDVRAVFVIEESIERLHLTLMQRDSPGGRRFRRLPEASQRAVVTMNADYGRWLREEAEATGLAWVSSQPWATLAQRVLDATPR